MNKLIRKYLTHGLTLVEKNELSEWVNSNKAHKLYFGLMRAIYLNTQTSVDIKEYNPQEGYEFFLKRTQNQVQPIRINLFSRWPMLKLAAAIVIVLVIGFAAFCVGRISLGRTDYFAVSLPNGKSVSHIVLPDGTEVDLNAASKLVYNETKHHRNVRLDGQAFFNVKHDRNKEFQVQAGSLTVTDIGTRFDVDAYHDNSQITVFLAEGKLSVEQKNKTNLIYLKPLDKIVFSKQTGKISVQKRLESNQKSWIDGKLEVDNICLSDLAKKLERFYNITITLADPEIRNYKFYGSFDLNKETVNSVLETLSSTNKIQFSQKDSTIVVRKTD